MNDMRQVSRKYIRVTQNEFPYFIFDAYIKIMLNSLVCGGRYQNTYIVWTFVNK
jgi:hypothetical protein